MRAHKIAKSGLLRDGTATRQYGKHLASRDKHARV